MISLLRVIRAISGYSFIILTPFTISAAFSLLDPSITKLTNFGIVTFVTLSSGWLFSWLYGLINRLYEKKHGVSHPDLESNPWAL